MRMQPGNNISPAPDLHAHANGMIIDLPDVALGCVAGGRIGRSDIPTAVFGVDAVASDEIKQAFIDRDQVVTALAVDMTMEGAGRFALFPPAELCALTAVIITHW